ncbi:hypothetical protein EEL51_07830 [Muribaculaceae bacterium Isolate-110 (HZI)]|nr:hypothetical protein EEL51_07830 [Muribaculaceae bacterium Isolate-110 (HZI)]
MFIAVFATLIASRLLLSIVTTLACNRRQSVYDNRGPVKIKLLGRTDKQGREIVFLTQPHFFRIFHNFVLLIYRGLQVAIVFLYSSTKLAGCTCGPVHPAKGGGD